MRLPSQIEQSSNFQVNDGRIALIVAVAGLILAFIQTFFTLPQQHRTFRVAIGFGILGLIVVGLIIASVGFVGDTIAFLIALTLLFILIIVAFWLWRRQHSRRFPRDYGTLLQSHVLQNLQLITRITNLLWNHSDKLQNQAQVLKIFLTQLESNLTASSPNAAFWISVVETRTDGKFNVVGSIKIDQADWIQMAEQFRWKDEVIGLAGWVAHHNQSHLCPDLKKPTQICKDYWTDLRDEGFAGGILCIPISFPGNYADIAKQQRPCLGVLSISCSHSDVLNIRQQELIQSIYVDLLASILMLYQLEKKIRSEPQD